MKEVSKNSYKEAMNLKGRRLSIKEMEEKVDLRRFMRRTDKIIRSLPVTGDDWSDLDWSLVDRNIENIKKITRQKNLDELKERKKLAADAARERFQVKIQTNKVALLKEKYKRR